MQIPAGCYGRIAPRSSLAYNSMITVGGGVVDSDYRGEIKVLLFNHSTNDFPIKAGDRVAQLICKKIMIPIVEEVKELQDTDRSEGGFGSTGLNA